MPAERIVKKAVIRMAMMVENHFFRIGEWSIFLDLLMIGNVVSGLSRAYALGESLVMIAGWFF